MWLKPQLALSMDVDAWTVPLRLFGCPSLIRASVASRFVVVVFCFFVFSLLQRAIRLVSHAIAAVAGAPWNERQAHFVCLFLRVSSVAG